MKKNSLNIYKISFAEDFFDSLIAGIVDKNSVTCKMKDLTILLPTKNSCVELQKRFSNYQEKPRIFSIGSLNDYLIKSEINNNHGSRFTLLKRINKILSSFIKDDLNLTLELSDYLFKLLTSIESHNISYEQITPLLTLENDLYNQKISKILIYFFEEWQKEDILTPAGYNNLLIKSLKLDNLIIAGVNSISPSILELYKNLLNSNNSHIILYGLDEYITSENWFNISENNAQYANSQICKYLEIEPNEVQFWHRGGKSSEFVSLSLRSAQQCDNWHELNNIKPENIEYFLANNQYEEAKIIIDLIKKYDEEKILIITPDENLTINIKLNLEFANIDFAIIRDFPLKSSLVGSWLELCLNFLSNRQSLITLVTLLKHPFSLMPEEELLRLEEAIRNNVKDIYSLVTEFPFLDELNQQVENFLTLGNFSSFNLFIEQHLLFAQNISKIDLWETQEAIELKKYFEQILTEYEYYQPININEYISLYHFFMSSAFYRPDNIEQKNIILSKPIDVRLFKSDLVILAGLNKDIWPAKTENDVFLKKLGINASNKNISESAYDFQSFLNNKKIILTSSEKISGTNSAPSHCLERILTLGRILPQRKIFNMQESLPNKIKTFANPPVEARPKKLSVTQLERLVFNPYHIYVDIVLALKKSPRIIKDISNLDFGNFIHKAIEIKFHHPEYSFSDAGQRALNILDLDHPQIKILWWPRFLRIANWYENYFKNNLGASHSHRVYLESKGFLNSNNFTLTAKADHIEINHNQVEIIDFKTGALPTIKSITNGESLQLLLEAIIAKDCGFSWMNKRVNYEITSLKYIQLSGGEEPAKILSVKFDQYLLDKTKVFMNELIESYEDQNKSYQYTKKKSLSYCHYSHLARQY